MKTLDLVEPGTLAVVRAVNGSGPVRKRILDMGLIKGAKVQMVRRAPLGDPIEFKLRGFTLSLRSEEAALVQIEEEEVKNE
jgi:ferrous iron transport protein A